MKSTWMKRAASVAAAALLAAGGTAALSSASADAAGNDGKVTSKGSLTVRDAPSKYAKANGAIRGGKTVPLSCKIAGSPVDGNRTWYQLPGDGDGMWVSGRYVKELKGTSTPYCRDNVKRPKIKVTKNLTVRHGPNTRDVSVGTLAAGRTVEVICKLKSQSVAGNDVWYQLPGSNWVSARYADNIGKAPGYCVQR